MLRAFKTSQNPSKGGLSRRGNATAVVHIKDPSRPEPVKGGEEVEHLRTEDILQWNHYRLRSPSTQQDCRSKSGFQRV
ncbi:unnamed protein product [Arctogadus glacialis]